MLLLLRSLVKLPFSPPATELGMGRVRFSFSFMNSGVELGWAGLGCIVLDCVKGGCLH